jgi:hypothetical protein
MSNAKNYIFISLQLSNITNVNSMIVKAATSIIYNNYMIKI